MKTSEKTTPITIIVIVIIVVGSVFYLPYVLDQVAQIQSKITTDIAQAQEEITTDITQEEMTLHISSSYTVTKVEDVNTLADMTIQGTIAKKYSAQESREIFGIDSSTVLPIPFLVYEIKPSHIFKGEETDSILVKVKGGTIDNLTVTSDHDELDLEERVVLLLNGPYNGLYQLVAGPYASFKIQDDKAIGKYEEIPLKKLQNMLI